MLSSRTSYGSSALPPHKNWRARPAKIGEDWKTPNKVPAWKETADDQLRKLLLSVQYFWYNQGSPICYHHGDSIEVFLGYNTYQIVVIHHLHTLGWFLLYGRRKVVLAMLESSVVMYSYWMFWGICRTSGILFTKAVVFLHFTFIGLSCKGPWFWIISNLRRYCTGRESSEKTDGGSGVKEGCNFWGKYLSSVEKGKNPQMSWSKPILLVSNYQRHWKALLLHIPIGEWLLKL